MTLLIYPISGSWVWNAGGWLGITDFAGSSVVHSVGGWASLVQL
jgi:Amt family ammonium transporter